MSHPTPTPSVATPAQVEPPPPPPASSDTHHSTPQSAASEEHDSIEHMIMSPPASWIEEPWNQEIPRPFREKIVRFLSRVSCNCVVLTFNSF